MTNNIANKETAVSKLTPQIKRIRQQPRHPIRQLLRSFEPLETFRKTVDMKN